MLIRNATDLDKEQLRVLFKECFGNMAENNGDLSWIKGRYKVAEIDNRIVAVSGILPISNSDYNGYEITWTCTTKEYRKQGLQVAILKQCLKELPEDGISLYCDCWRVKDNDKINLHSVMKHLGMNEVLRNRINRKYPHSKDCNGCPYESENCFCCGDLYMKARK